MGSSLEGVSECVRSGKNESVRSEREVGTKDEDEGVCGYPWGIRSVRGRLRLDGNGEETRERRVGYGLPCIAGGTFCH